MKFCYCRHNDKMVTNDSGKELLQTQVICKCADDIANEDGSSFLLKLPISDYDEKIQIEEIEKKTKKFM